MEPTLPGYLSLEDRIQDSKSDVEGDNHTWKSLCLVVDRRAVQYFTQIFIITGMMAFCMFKLETDTSREAQQSYTGLLTLLIGILAPSPKFK